MTTFTNIPEQIKEVMEKLNGASSRRDFLKGSGLFVVSFSAAAVADAVRPESDVHASGAYRSRLVDLLTRRALRDALDRSRNFTEAA